MTLREAIVKVLEGFEKELFVRNTARDSERLWGIELAPYLIALARLQKEIP